MAIESVSEAHQSRPVGKGLSKRLGTAEVGQIGIILNSIAELAASVERLTVNQISDEVNQARASELVAIKCMAQQIGWLADLGGDKSGAGQCFGDAEVWMMPQAYLDLSQKEVARG